MPGGMGGDTRGSAIGSPLVRHAARADRWPGRLERQRRHLLGLPEGGGTLRGGDPLRCCCARYSGATRSQIQRPKTGTSN